VRALVQRVDSAQVVVAGEVVGAIEGPGLLALVGVTHTDDPAAADRLAAKVYGLRIFEADRLRELGAGCLPPGAAREVSAQDAGLPVLVVSQFTLYGATTKGRRPTWEAAAPGPVAEPLVDRFANALRGLGAEVAQGRFGADMRVSLVNDGPITLLLEV
jgi:D-tyrosyl-tRNA(Tyr) deacylase